jgi:hypothetical protein
MLDTYAEYEPSIRLGVITLAREEVSKAFRLTASGMEVTYTSGAPVNFRIPLAVDPQAFFSGSAIFISSLTPGIWTWGTEGGFQVEVSSAGNLSAEGFTIAKASLESPEDPDKEYPSMHYFPFPFSLVTVTGEGQVLVTIGGK